MPRRVRQLWLSCFRANDEFVADKKALGAHTETSDQNNPLTLSVRAGCSSALLRAAYMVRDAVVQALRTDAGMTRGARHVYPKASRRVLLASSTRPNRFAPGHCAILIPAAWIASRTPSISRQRELSCVTREYRASRGRSSVVERQLPKLYTRVRFPPPAPNLAPQYHDPPWVCGTPRSAISGRWTSR
jgi:hypothetical protein